MSKLYTYSSWVDTFKPITNKFSKDPDCTNFETYGEELEHVRHTDINHVWTEVDGEEGTYILAGYRLVNRIQYYITENPWSDEDTEVPTWVYRQCDCAEENEDGEYNPECLECDEGMIDIPTDTVADLIEIYGEAIEIVR